MKQILIFLLLISFSFSWSQEKNEVRSSPKVSENSDTLVDYSKVDTTKHIHGSKQVSNISITANDLNKGKENKSSLFEEVNINVSFDLPTEGEEQQLLIEISSASGKNRYVVSNFPFSKLKVTKKRGVQQVLLEGIQVPIDEELKITITLQYQDKIQGPAKVKFFTL